MRNLVPRSRSFQDLFDDRRDLDRVFGRVSSGGTFDKAPPSATSAASLPATRSYIDKNAQTYPCRVSLARVDPKIIEELRERRETVAIGGERKAQRSETDVVLLCEEVTDGFFERTFTLRGGPGHGPMECGIPDRRPGVDGARGGRWAATPHLRACFRRRTLFFARSRVWGSTSRGAMHLGGLRGSGCGSKSFSSPGGHGSCVRPAKCR